MQEIKKLRKTLGLLQSELAELLQVSTGHLAMAEIGKRVLSSDTQINLAILQQAIEATVQGHDPEQAILKSDKVTQTLNKLIRANSHLLTGYLDKQEKQLEQIMQRQRLIAIGEQAKTELIWPEGSEALDLYKLLRRKAEHQLIEINSEYIKLKIKIYGLQNEIELANVLKSV